MTRNLLVTTSVLALGLSWGTAAFAQQDQAVESVTVTGSRIVREGYQAPTPMQAMPAASLEQANPSNLGDSLRQIPVLSASVGARGSTGSGGSGGTFLNLRNLGQGNTLVLLDGNRFVPTTPNSTIDINMLPQNLVSRVDIVTGGASAAYGSDAVTGVVNFVLDREYVGFKGNLRGGVDNMGTAQEAGLDLAFGTSFGNGRGHFLSSLELYKSQGVYSLLGTKLGQRSCQNITLPAGSATTQGFYCDVRSSQANFTGLIGAGPLKGTTFDVNGAPIPFNYGTLVTSTTMVGGDGIKLSFLPGEIPAKRGVFYNRASWDFSDSLSAYAEVSYGIANYDYQIGSYDQNLGTTALTIQKDNAYLPQSLKDRMTAAGVTNFALNKYFANLPRSWIQNHNNTLRLVAGFEGKMFKDWTYDAHFEHGQTNSSVYALQDEDLGHMALASDAIVNPATGQIVCRSTIANPTNGCVPYNVFGSNGISPPATGEGFNGATDGQLKYLTGTDWKKTKILQDNAAVNIHGNPFDNWAGPVSVATGMEYRKESMNQISDPYGFTVSTITNAPGQYRVGNYGPQVGSYDVVEGYVETVVPLLRNLPFAQSVDFNGAVRETGYSTSGNTFTYKGGVTWDVNDDVRFRATRSRDVRAPNLTELFAGVSFGHGPIVDYLTPGNPVNAQAFNFTQGNAALKAEVGNTTTAGIVLQPSWLAGFQTSVDWFNIDISNNISSISSQQIVLNCSQGSTAQCAYITRDAAGNLTGVYAVPQNLLNQSYAGVDLESSYNFDLQDVTELDGNITLHGILNYVYKYIQATQGVPTANAAGTQGNPMWRGTFQVSYNNGPFTWFTQARWSGQGVFSKQIPVTTLPRIHIGAQTLIDMNVEYSVPVGHGAVVPFLNVTDIFNDTPPPDPNPNTAAYGSNQYDPLGRTFHAGIRFKF
ncbi:MAG: hypothetical protein JWN16_1997 [Alphaproteobacteria bacterium]|nr:hypothetical protein [Alphaproteobacteria bacterium]